MSGAKKPKILVILGPTSSGKSSLAVELAKKFDGEVISADSRQVYTGLDLGTGKITKEEMGDIPHHLLNVGSPEKSFSVALFKKLADKKIEEILDRGKLPIIAGGTGFYIEAIVDGVQFPEVKPNKKLRSKLEEKSVEELFEMLKKEDPLRARCIDSKNKRRLIRAIEVVRSLGKTSDIKKNPEYEALQIGIETPDKELKEKIHKRLIQRIEDGMVEEAKRLNENGLSLERMIELGLEYKYLAFLSEGKMSKKEMIEELDKAIWKYVKRQKTWFKRDGRIKWFKLSEIKEIEKEVKKFIA